MRSRLCATAFITVAFASPIQAKEPPHPEREVDDEIVVTGSPIQKSPDELAIPVNSLDRDHIVSHLGTTLGETLDGEVGVTTSGFAPGASRPIVRGQDSFRVRVLENGLGTADVSAISGDHGVPVNPLAARRIEVIRGPATLRYGGGAIAGAVNVLTHLVPRRSDEPFSGEVYLGWGSVADQGDAAAQLEGALGPIALHADGLLRRSDDYDLPGRDARQDNTDTAVGSVGGGAAYVGEKGRFGGGYQLFENDYGISEPGEPTPASIELRSQNADVEADWRFESGPFEEIRLRGRYTDYEHDEIVAREAVSRFRADTWEGRAESLHAPILEGGAGALGVHAFFRDFEARGEGAELLSPSETLTFAGYLFEQLPIGDRVSIELGGRAESTQVRGRTEVEGRRRRSFVPLSGALQVLGELSPAVDLGLNLAVSQRAPDALELFAMGPHEADATFQLGDASADEETSYNAELLVRGDLAPVSFEASVFYTYYDRFLYGRLTGNTRDEDGTLFLDDSGALRELRYTQDDAHFYGFELAGEASLFEIAGGDVGLDAQTDFVRARLDGGANVPRIPPLRWGAGVFFAGDGLRARVGFLRHEAQNRAGEFESETSGYTLLDASLAVRLLGNVGSPALELVVAGDNLTDARARSAVSLKKQDQRLPGRAVRLGLRGYF
jgi:iron complex outermembrane receptor protein